MSRDGCVAMRSYQGTTLHSPARTPSAAVVLLHGSEGGAADHSRRQAARLARAGILASAFCWFGWEGLPPRIERIPLDRTETFLAWFRDGPAAGLPVVLYGVSRGAEQALLLATLRADTHLFDGIAVHAGTDTVVASHDPSAGAPIDGEGGFSAAWTWRGRDVYGERGLPFGSGPRIAIEGYPGRLWLSHGEDDSVWSAERSRRLVEARGSLPTELRLWAGEGHVVRSRVTVAARDAHLALFVATTPSAPIRQFLGSWRGMWGGTRESSFVVERVNGQHVSFRYEIAGAPPLERTVAASLDGTLAFGPLVFRLAPDARALHGLHQRGGRVGGTVTMCRAT